MSSFNIPLDAYPSGVIVWYHGKKSEIPNGWNLCDGNNGTPNLLELFPRSIPDSTTDPGSTGGSNFISLATSQLPSHDHGGSTSTDDPGDHRHGMPKEYNTAWGNGNANLLPDNDWEDFSSTDGSHTHSASIADTGNGDSIDNQPSYVKLIPIQKTA